MATKKAERSPWERPDWPKRGDRSMEKLYAAVGRTLGQWENYEAHLALLFSYFVNAETSVIAQRSYSAVRTFEGRSQMLRAASEAYFTHYPSATLQNDFKKILKHAVEFSRRRNDIAHGTVGHFRPQAVDSSWRPRHSYAWFPSYVTFRDRDVANVPAYCYTSKELDILFDHFRSLTHPVSHLSGAILHHYRQPFPQIRAELYPLATNRVSEKKR